MSNINDLIYKINLFIDSNNLIKPYTNIIIGLSGGPDSVFLLYVLKELSAKYNITILAAHLDHEWRLDSYKDALFCKKLCENLEINLEIAKASDIILTKKSKSLEEKGRLLRRSFFESLAIKNNASAIALGHHADDQQETFLIRLIRVSTSSGLASIRAKQDLYIRPLINIPKSDIINYLKLNNLDYIIDITNESEDFLRNRIRRQAIPILRSCDNRFDLNFNKTINYIAQTEKFLEDLTEKTFEKISHTIGSNIFINISELYELDIFMQKRIIIFWLCKNSVQFNLSDNFLTEILRFLKNSKANKHNINLNWSIEKNYPFASICKLST